MADILSPKRRAGRIITELRRCGFEISPLLAGEMARRLIRELRMQRDADRQRREAGRKLER